MALVDSLLAAIVRADGDALVLHAGERPYVVAPTGQSELSTRYLTLDAMVGMLNELLPADARRSLEEDGAVQHGLAAPSSNGDSFRVVAARGGEDVWIEIRRHRKVAEPVPPPVEVAPPAVESAPSHVEPPPPPHVEPPPAHVEPPPPVMAAEPKPEPPPPPPAPEPAVEEPQEVPVSPAQQEWTPDVAAVADDASVMEHVIPTEEFDYEHIHWHQDVAVDEPVPAHASYEEERVEMHHFVMPDMSSEETHVAPEPAAAPEPTHEPIMGQRSETPVDLPAQPVEPPSAVVLSMARPHARNEQTVRLTKPLHSDGIERLLRIAAARGASTLYLTSQGQPSIRVDGEIGVIEGEAVLSEPDVESLILDIIPERNRETLHNDAGTEWICDVPDVGRVRCVTFRDHRGAGGIFRMLPARAISAEQLGLSREIQGLCGEAEGLALITGPRSSGKSTLIAAFVDLINRTRSDHVVTLENQIKFVHENRLSLVSQREVRGDNGELLRAARAALRENPDVLVIEELRSPEVMALALEAAQSGHLVIGALTAHTTSGAIERIIDQAPQERRAKIQLGLAEALRGVVAQVLLRKSGGGRVAAREVLLNSTAVANLIAEGKTSQLPMAIDSGRRHGMVPLNDALATFVQSGVVESREAYRQASDQQGFLAQLRRQGIDTSFVERLA